MENGYILADTALRSLCRELIARGFTVHVPLTPSGIVSLLRIEKGAEHCAIEFTSNPAQWTCFVELGEGKRLALYIVGGVPLIIGPADIVQCLRPTPNGWMRSPEEQKKYLTIRG